MLPTGGYFRVPNTDIIGRVLDGGMAEGFSKVEITGGSYGSKVRTIAISPCTEVMMDDQASAILDRAKASSDADIRAKLAALRPIRAPQECLCGCGGMTKGGKFLPGHDSKYHAAQKMAKKRAETPASIMNALRLISSYTAGSMELWALAGQPKASCRAHVMSALLGRKATQRESGVGALRSALYEALFVKGQHDTAREDDFRAKATALVGG